MIVTPAEESTLLLAEIISAQAELKEAEQELESLGITPSPFDTECWLKASRKQRQELARRWAVIQMTGYPDWKTRNRK